MTYLGDAVESALGALGISQKVVEDWLGRPCNCEERKQKLNELHRWAHRVVGGQISKAKHYLQTLLSEGEER